MNVLQRLKAMLTPETIEESTEDPLPLATAALLFEVVWADHEIKDGEMDVLKSALKETLSISDAAVADLVEETLELQHAHVGVFEFTRTLNELSSMAQREALVENLWCIAFADGGASAIEEHTIRRISELLYVAQPEYVKAKQRARTKMQPSG